MFILTGASLYLIYVSRQDGGIPRNPEDQATFWQKYYRPELTVGKFLDAIEERNTGQGCFIFK